MGQYRLAANSYGGYMNRFAGTTHLVLVLQLTIPLAVKSAGGWAFPGLFALGAPLPLLALAGVLGVGLGTADRLLGGVMRLDRPLRMAAGLVLLLAGLRDTLVYWLV